MKSADPNQPRTWVRFKKDLCRSCWASCCHGMAVEVSVPDLIRLGLLDEEEASENLRAAVRRLNRRGILRPSRPEAVVFVLRQKRNRDCLFLDEKRRCTVYATRPEICRQFPKIGPKPGYCPYRPK